MKGRKKHPKKSRKRVEETEEGKRPSLVSGLPPELTKDEALTPGVVKLFVKDIEEKTQKIDRLEIKIDTTLNEKSLLQTENAVLKTKKEYSIFWDILITLAGISGGGAVAFWLFNKDSAILCGIITIALFFVVIFARKR